VSWGGVADGLLTARYSLDMQGGRLAKLRQVALHETPAYSTSASASLGQRYSAAAGNNGMQRFSAHGEPGSHAASTDTSGGAAAGPASDLMQDEALAQAARLEVRQLSN
jgi:hypothetical protein